MKKLRLPVPGSSLAGAVWRLEEISCAIHKSVQEYKNSARSGGQLRTPSRAYEHFRKKAFKLLSHYVDTGFQDAFRFLLAMKGRTPSRMRGSVRGNEFHFGLLAMSAAANIQPNEGKDFMSRNRLRELAALMNQAHQEGIKEADFNDFVARERRSARDDRVVVDRDRGRQIRQRSIATRRASD